MPAARAGAPRLTGYYRPGRVRGTIISVCRQGNKNDILQAVQHIHSGERQFLISPAFAIAIDRDGCLATGNQAKRAFPAHGSTAQLLSQILTRVTGLALESGLDDLRGRPSSSASRRVACADNSLLPITTLVTRERTELSNAGWADSTEYMLGETGMP